MGTGAGCRAVKAGGGLIFRSRPMMRNWKGPDIIAKNFRRPETLTQDDRRETSTPGK